MLMKKNLSIIIVHWNTPNSLRILIALLKKSKDYQITVVDNASDQKLDWLQKESPAIHLIQNKINRGYASACNQGALKVVGETARYVSQSEAGGWLLFLNPDVVIKPHQIYEVIKFAVNNKLDACSIKIDQSYQKPLPSWLSLLIEFTPLVKLVSLDLFKEKTLFGGCLLIKTGVLKSIGGWDERFFLWFEDSDLTLRLIKKGFKIGWIPLDIKHFGGASFKNLNNQYKRDIFFNSMDIFAKKHFNTIGQLIVNLIKRKYTSRNLLPKIFDGISIVVPNLKKDLLRSFFQNNKLYTSGVEWIIVTSSIRNQDIWEWRKQYPEIRFIQIEENKGFASTVNIGFQLATGKWIGSINDDIIVNKGWLNNLLAYADKSVGSINPVIYKTDGTVESAGIKILKKGKAVAIARIPSLNGRAEMVKVNCIEIDATNAAAVIYSKEALNKVGLFDEKFGSYLEDIDLSLRLTRAGYKNIVSLKSMVKHVGQSSSKDLGIKKQLYDFRNWIYVILKNWGLKDFVLNFPSMFFERLRNISGIIKSLLNTDSN